MFKVQAKSENLRDEPGVSVNWRFEDDLYEGNMNSLYFLPVKVVLCRSGACVTLINI